MTQLELSYEDMPQLSEDSRAQPERLVVNQQISEFTDLQLVSLPAANESFTPDETTEASAGLVGDEADSAASGESTASGKDGAASRFVILGDQGAAASALQTQLESAGCRVQIVDVEAGQPTVSVEHGVDIALIDSDDFDWVVSQVQACQRHPAYSKWGLITHGQLTAEQRCELLELGVVEVLENSLGGQEKTLRCTSAARRQRSIANYSEKPLHYPESGAFHLPYLIGVGNTLYATAQRGHISLVVAVMRLTEAALAKQPDIAEFIACCQHNLRDTDVFARCSNNEFVAVVTNATRHNISGIFERLAERVAQGIALEPGVHAVEIGVTLDCGVTFESMIQRASGALQQAGESQRLLVLK